MEKNNMTIEIYKPLIKNCGGIENAIKAGFYTEWTPERIKKAFNFGNGTEKDFLRYKKDNAPYCIFKEIRTI